MHLAKAILFLTVAGLSLAACNQHTAQAPGAPATGAPIASLPLAEGAPPPLIAAPALAALPAAAPIQTIATPQRERYRYIDRAQSLGAAFADSPPDYTVDYQGVRPWIWRSNRGEYRVVEPTPHGDRTYYFDAGSDAPFLVSDPEYVYGYDQGSLAAVYTANGDAAPYDTQAAERAARYLARARALYDAAIHEQRQAAYAQAWRERRARVLADQQAWAANEQRDADWRAWHEQHQRAEQPDWDRERSMRVAYAAQTAAAIGAAIGEARQPAPGPTRTPNSGYGSPTRPPP
ncbi:MAG TPA: hypothetical protein VIJ94_09405, partial [Caulobacteraceae bacterium]